MRAKMTMGVASLVCILGAVLYLTAKDVDVATVGVVLFVGGFLVAAGARFLSMLKA